MDDVDYADAIVSFFLEKRGKGSAESSRDQVKIERWEQEGVPLDQVLTAIAMAFERSLEPPRSVSACGRWLTQLQKAEARAIAGHVAEVFGSDHDGVGGEHGALGAAAPARPTESMRGASDDEELLLARLEQIASDSPVPALVHAASSLAAQVRELIAEDGGLDAATRAALPEAWTELVLETLPLEARSELEADAHAAVAAQQLSPLAPVELRQARHVEALRSAIATRWLGGVDPIGSE